MSDGCSNGCGDECQLGTQEYSSCQVYGLDWSLNGTKVASGSKDRIVKMCVHIVEHVWRVGGDMGHGQGQEM